jgi:hypothetical protein
MCSTETFIHSSKCSAFFQFRKIERESVCLGLKQMEEIVSPELMRHRRHLTNLAHDIISRTKKSITRAEESIMLMSDGASNLLYVKKKRDEIATLNATITVQRECIVAIRCGAYDQQHLDEMKANKEQQKVAAELKQNLAQKKKQATAEVARDRNTKWKKNMEILREMDSEKYQRKQMGYYHENKKAFPRPLQQKLANMPNNRGFVWNSIWFMGERPADSSGKCIVNERKGQKFLVHEYFPTGEYVVFEKDKNGRRSVLSRVQHVALVPNDVPTSIQRQPKPHFTPTHREPEQDLFVELDEEEIEEERRRMAEWIDHYESEDDLETNIE